MSRITLTNVEFTLDPEQLLDAIAALDAQELSDMLDELTVRHPMGLIVRLARTESNRGAMAAELSGFAPDTETDIPDDREAFLDKVAQFVNDEGMYELVSGAELERDCVEFAVEYREDEILESLQDAGTIPSFDLDDLRYNVREIVRLASEVENDIGA